MQGTLRRLLPAKLSQAQQQMVKTDCAIVGQFIDTTDNAATQGRSQGRGEFAQRKLDGAAQFFRQDRFRELVIPE